jgi:hypothetical protein
VSAYSTNLSDKSNDEGTRGPIQEWDGRMAEVFECYDCSKEYIVFY